MLIYLNFSRFFSHIQEADWYDEFLSPVVDGVSQGSRVLDIGTGPGKLLKRLFLEKSVQGTGVDTSRDMLLEASKKLEEIHVDLRMTQPGNELPFPDHSFDCVTICNVLFNLDKQSGLFILEEARRVVRPGGKILVLTPSGNGGFWKLTKSFFSPGNLSVYTWYYATRRGARIWFKNNLLTEFSQVQNLKYTRKEILRGFALMESLGSE